MDCEYYANDYDGFWSNDRWVDISNSHNLSQHQLPLYEHRGLEFMQPIRYNGLPAEHYTQRIPQSLLPNANDQQLPPLILPRHPAWPSLLTNPANYSKAAPVAIPPLASAPLIKGNGTQLPAIQAIPSPRKTLTDRDRRRMCQYHEENPSVKQTEIGVMFGIERSTVSKVLRQKEKYLSLKDHSLPLVKRTKGKFPNIERALSNWARNMQKQGYPLTDAAIKEKARFFATTVSNSGSHLKTNSTSWLEEFKQKNGIRGTKPTPIALEANISDSKSLARDPPTPDDARRALDTLNNFFPVSGGLIDQNDYMTLLKLTEKLQRQQSIVQQRYRLLAPKVEQSSEADMLQREERVMY